MERDGEGDVDHLEALLTRFLQVIVEGLHLLLNFHVGGIPVLTEKETNDKLASVENQINGAMDTQIDIVVGEFSVRHDELDKFLIVNFVIELMLHEASIDLLHETI